MSLAVRVLLAEIEQEIASMRADRIAVAQLADHGLSEHGAGYLDGAQHVIDRLRAAMIRNDAPAFDDAMLYPATREPSDYANTSDATVYPDGYVHEAKTVCATCGEDWPCHHEYTRTQIEALRTDLADLAEKVEHDYATVEDALAVQQKWQLA